MRLFLILGSLAAASGVALGAFGAHALRDILQPRMLDAWKTAVSYQLIHALGLILIAILLHHFPAHRGLLWAGGLLAAGILLFSGSIYGLAAGWSWLGPVTPMGGFCFIFGWLVLLVSAWRGLA